KPMELHAGSATGAVRRHSGSDSHRVVSAGNHSKSAPPAGLFRSSFKAESSRERRSPRHLPIIVRKYRRANDNLQKLHLTARHSVTNLPSILVSDASARNPWSRSFAIGNLSP